MDEHHVLIASLLLEDPLDAKSLNLDVLLPFARRENYQFDIVVDTDSPEEGPDVIGQPI
jgi:hypothetical protein